MSNARNLADLSSTNKKQLAKAWVKFDGKTGAVATIKSSYGVTSVVRNSAGDYTVTLTTAMPDVNYIVAAVCGSDTGNNVGVYACTHLSTSPTTTVYRLQTWYGYASASIIDAPSVNLVFFSN